MPWAIETNLLTKQFPQPRGWRNLIGAPQPGTLALDGVSLRVREGELFGLLGPNGAGKTTLIKLLATLVLPTAGAARVNGYDLGQETQIKCSIGLTTGDERSFYWRLNARQNLAFFASLHGLHGKECEARVEEVLADVDALDFARVRFSALSSGMRQRVAIARALLNRPRLLFLDEPSKALDPTAAQQVRELVRRLNHQGVTVFLTTHRLDEAEALCDRVAILHRGRLQAVGAVDELRGLVPAQERVVITARGLSLAQADALRAGVSGAQVTLLDGLGERSRIEFSAAPGSPALGDALSLLGRDGTRVERVEQESVSLEEIFEQFTQDEDHIETTPITPNPLHLSPSPLPPVLLSPPPLSLSPLSLAPLRLSLAFLRRDLLNEASYRFSFLLQLGGILISIAIFYFLGELVGGAASSSLQAYGSDYFAFALIGMAFAGYFNVGLSSFADTLRQSQTSGTLEAMLATPAGLPAILVFSSQWSYLTTTLQVFLYLAVGALMRRIDLLQADLLAVLVVLVVSVISFSGLGMLSAGFIMVLKRGDPVTWVLGNLAGLLGGIFYPVNLLPGLLQFLAGLLPLTYALHAMRLVLLMGAGLNDVRLDLLALAGFSLVFVPLGLAAFRYAVNLARRDGTLTHY